MTEREEQSTSSRDDDVQTVEKQELLRLSWFSLQSIHRHVGLGTIYPIDVAVPAGGDKKEVVVDKLLQANDDGVCDLNSALQLLRSQTDHELSPTEGTESASLTAEDLHQLNLEQLKHVYIDLFAKQLLMAGGDDSEPMSLTVRNAAFTEKSAMINFLLSTFELKERDLSEDLLNTVVALRLKKKWDERMNSRCSTFSQLLHLLSPVSIRNLYSAQGFGSVLKNKDNKSKSYNFYDTSSNVVEWKRVVERLESIKLADMDHETFQTFTEMYDGLKHVKDTLADKSSESSSPVSAEDVSLLSGRFFKDLCVLRGVGSWDYGIYRFVFMYKGSSAYDHSMVLTHLLSTGLTKGELQQYIENMMERLFPSPTYTHQHTPKKWKERLESTSVEFSDFHLQFLPQSFIVKLYTAKNLGELKTSAEGDYEFLDEQSNTISWNEAKEKVLTVVNWEDILNDGWYRQIYKEIRNSLRLAWNSYKCCSKPSSALASKIELLQLPSCILKDLCSVRYEFLSYLDIQRYLTSNCTLDEEGLANILLLTAITKGELLLYTHATMLRLTPATPEIEN